MIMASIEMGAEQLKQAIPGGCRLRAEALRHRVAGGIQYQPSLDRNAEVGAAVDAELGHGCPHFGVRHDARTAAAQGRRRALEDIDLPAALAQVERAEKPAHGAADNHGAAPSGSHFCTIV